MENILIRLIGYAALIIHGDSSVFDRWMWLKKHIQSGHLRTLDAGCGSGVFTMYAAKKGNEAVGVSFDENNTKKAIERAKILNVKNVKFIQGDLRKLDEMSGSLGKFDQVICFETIEHIINDKKVIKDISALLNKGGRLLLTAPYLYYGHMYGENEYDESKAGVIGVEDGGHVRRGYTHKQMADLLKSFGCEVQTAEYITGYLSQHLISFQRMLATNINSKLAWIIVLPLRIFPPLLDPVIGKITKYPYLSIGVVAVKK